MRAKDLDFSEVYDVRALRVIVDRGEGLLHRAGHRAPALAADPERVRRLHLPSQGQRLPLAAYGRDGRGRPLAGSADPHPGDAPARRTRRRRALALQGKPAHRRGRTAYDEKIAWLRQLLSWRDEVTDAADWVEQYKRAALDDTIYVLTPQGRVIDLPRGRDAGRFRLSRAHRSRPPLPRRQGGRPSGAAQHAAGQRPAGGDHHRQAGRSVARLAQSAARLPGHVARAGQGQALVRGARGSGDAVAGPRDRHARVAARRPDPGQHRRAGRTSSASPTPMRCSSAAARGEVGPRAIQVALRGAPEEAAAPSREIQTRKSRAGDSGDGVLVVGVGQAADPARPLLQAGAAGRDPRLRHARQGRLGAPRRLLQLRAT